MPLKLTPASKILHVSLADDDGAFTTQVMVSELRSRKLVVESVTFDSRSTDADIQRLGARLDSSTFDVVVLSTLVRARSGKGSVGLMPTAQRVADELTKRDLPLVVVSFGNPYLLAAIPAAKTYVAAYSPYPVSQRAAARALTGEIAVSGRLPVSIPGICQRGQGVNLPGLPGLKPRPPSAI